MLCSRSISSDQEFLLEMCSDQPAVLQKLPLDLASDKEFMLACIKETNAH